jgi:hypothetical protein
MRLLALVLLLPVVLGCESTERSPHASSASSSSSAATEREAQDAAHRACSVYHQAPLWGSRDIDTNDDGVEDFTEVFTVTDSEDRVRQLAASADEARRDSKFNQVATAVDFLVSVHARGGDRSEVLDAEVGMTAACHAIEAAD